MTAARVPLVTLLLSACASGQLVELEEEHAALRREYDDLAANVEALRREMVEVGLVTEAQANARAAVPVKGSKGGKAQGPGRKKPGMGGAARPDTELTAMMPWSATRTGNGPTLPALPPAERAAGPCGWKFSVESLQPLSDFPLNRDGFGKSGPVVLLEDGQPLAAHATPETFEAACAGAFRHAGYLVLYSPTGTVDDGARRTYQLSLAPEFPLPRGEDARPMYWVYPGTTVTVKFERGWDPAWGEPKLTLAGRVLLAEDGSAGAKAPGLSADLTDEGNFNVAQVLELDDRPFTVEISSTPDGPYVLVDTFTLGNADHAVVVTAEAAWASRTR